MHVFIQTLYNLKTFKYLRFQRGNTAQLFVLDLVSLCLLWYTYPELKRNERAQPLIGLPADRQGMFCCKKIIANIPPDCKGKTM